MTRVWYGKIDQQLLYHPGLYCNPIDTVGIRKCMYICLFTSQSQCDLPASRVYRGLRHYHYGVIFLFSIIIQLFFQTYPAVALFSISFLLGRSYLQVHLLFSRPYVALFVKRM